MVRDISAKIEEAGIKYFLEVLHRDTLAQLAEQAEVQFKEGDNSKNKRVLQRKLGLVMNEKSVDDFLQDICSEDDLKALCEELGVEPASAKKEQLVRQLGTIVRELGMESYFSSFNADCLADICDDLKIKTYGSSNKRKLVESIISKEDMPKPEKKKRKIAFSKKKKPIKKGVTYDDIFQHYNVDEVRAFCKENKVKASGKKSDLINRVLAFLDGDESVLAKDRRGRKKEKK
eukprot:CAMPEP_0174269378 /NCGR_PEP_ID=MMETSP0439-20130205/40771_1 /TAXON_ID=0 /ORGANISM="Stereomyxa ramosa, Strain Chinc5" /LENGTH=231 /DNA_ID=CAMNT_0015358113 /DNA_START=186 /DNA_END=881 /DNA_ORIENTATION=-